MSKAQIKIQQLQTTTVIKIVLPTGACIEGIIHDEDDKMTLTSADNDSLLTVTTTNLNTIIIKPEEKIKP